MNDETIVQEQVSFIEQYKMPLILVGCGIALLGSIYAYKKYGGSKSEKESSSSTNNDG